MRKRVLVSVATVALLATALPSMANANNPTVWAGTINQSVDNNRPSTNDGSTFVGKVSGPGASASASATGASAAVAVTSIQGTTKGTHTSKQAISSITVGTINQTSINNAAVTNNGWVTGYKKLRPDVTGPGATVSTGATGAATVVSLTSINDTKFPTVSVAKINQRAVNNNYVTNKGHVQVGKVSGAGAFAGTSAIGASAVVSVNITGYSGGRYPRR